jgi:hypothetical protein
MNMELLIGGYVIAGTAIWAIGATEAEALADYHRGTGDTDMTLDNISRDTHGGATFIAPATEALLESVENNTGGTFSWSERDGLQCTNAEAKAYDSV